MDEKFRVSVAAAGKRDIEKMVVLILDRYRMLYPNWEISLVTIEKQGDRNQQPNCIIDLLEQMKE